MIVFAKPLPGMRVRNPDNNYKPLPAGGDYVQDSAYWRRQQREGGVDIEAPLPKPKQDKQRPPKAAPKATAKPAAKEEGDK